jgi:Tfp pilus assembly protein PilN
MISFGDIVSIFAVLAGVGGVVWQMARQHRSNLLLQKEQYREQLRIEIYKTVDRTINTLTTTES